MKTFFVPLCLLVSVCLSAQTTIKSKKYGTLDFAELDYGLASVEEGSTVLDKNSPTGTKGWLRDFAIIKKTDSIQIKPDVNFGVVYQINASKETNIKVDIEWEYPETITNERGEKFKSIRYSTERPTNTPSASSYNLGEPYEMVEGKWTENIYIDKKKVFTRTFYLYK